MNNAQEKCPANGVITVVLTYAFFAGLWALLSDQALGLLLQDADVLVQARLATDGFFVALTTLLLFLALRRLTGTLALAPQRQPQQQTVETTLQSVVGLRDRLAKTGPARAVDGHDFGADGITRCTTPRKRDEDAVRRLADDLNATLQAIPDPLFEFDADGRFIKVRSADPSLLAAPPEHMLGRLVSEVLPAEAAATLMQALQAAGRNGRDYGRTMTVPMAAGERQFEISVCRKPQIDGLRDRFIVLSRDITARTAAEAELRQRNRDLQRFNRASIERELRMVALKCEVNQMARAAGFPAPYDTSFITAPAELATL